MPKADRAKPPAERGSVLEAIETLETRRKRRAAAAGKALKPKRGDLDLDQIP